MSHVPILANYMHTFASNAAIGGPLKRAIDVFLSSIAIVVLAPFFLLAAMLLAFSDGGPIIYKHQRIGHGGRQFPCFKFRTMIVDSQKLLDDLLGRDHTARAEWEKNRKLANDPRITRVGQFLRRSSLDELPQLINVLRGEMSLVGPRPIVVSELALYGDQLESYLSARPGITGIWQVSGRSDCSYDERVKLDVHYVNNWKVSTDLFILFNTVTVVFAQGGSY